MVESYLDGIIQELTVNYIQISKHSITIDVLVITLLWCLAVAVVKPAGDFPLNDDWSYGLVVKRLIEDKVFHPTG